MSTAEPDLAAAEPAATELDSIRDTARRFAERVVAPGAAERDRTGQWPEDELCQAADHGLLGISTPEELHGSGLGLREACVITEEVSYACMSTATLVTTAYMVIDSLLRSAPRDLQERLVPGLVEGRLRGANAITEPGAGSDALGMRTTATRTDDGWLLSGAKTFITGAPIADIALVYAREKDSGAIGCFAVHTDRDGVECSVPFEKMGWRASPTGELALDSVWVSDDDVVALPGDGVAALMKGLNSERIYLAAHALGLARAAFDLAIEQARVRHQFGRPIGDFQLVRAKLADMYVGIESTRGLMDRAVSAVRQDNRGHQARLLSSAAKLAGSEMVNRVTSEAVQIFGGSGYMSEFPVERMMRDAKIFEIGGGTSEIQRDLMGKTLLAGDRPTAGGTAASR